MSLLLPVLGAAAAATAWPSCITRDSDVRTPTPLYTDVRPFIHHPDKFRYREVTYYTTGPIGMYLRDSPSELGEVVENVQEGSQAWFAGVRAGWMITAINGKPFRSGERLQDVVRDFDQAKSKTASMVVQFDVRSYMDCANSDCTRSDRFPTDFVEACADACSQVPSCEWWVFGMQDRDNTCWLRSQGNGFVSSPGVVVGPRSCVPSPVGGSGEAFPECTVLNGDLRAGEPLVTDVRSFIDHPDEVRHRVVDFTSSGYVGMVLREEPHDLGEVVSDVVPGSQAASAAVRPGWIITEVDGKPFRSGERLLDVVADFGKAKADSPTLTVKFDVRTSLDCKDADCTRSDKFPASSTAVCASACAATESCAWWSLGMEEEDSMCWLRTSGSRLKFQEGSVSGSRGCAPPQGWRWSLLGLAVIAGVAVYFRQPVYQRLSRLTKVLSTKGGVKASEPSKVLELGKLMEWGLEDEDPEESDKLLEKRRR
mmetsp:Transcript_10376/g.26422  ORF Transcript_10376/g.26422 Transcript_10376/m.26422 type:complete len:482 (-) Transcript_10376:116-1561(-)